LILSGVVVKFDKLNPAIGNTATVPVVGDLMASRWAFEAAMVSQFKDNVFEREFYLHDKVMADADYKKIYFIPEVETRLQYCLNNYKSANPEIKERVQQSLNLVNREVSRELEGTDQKLDALAKLTPELFDIATFDAIMKYLETLKKFYVNRFNSVDKQREKKIFDYTNTPEKQAQFNLFRESYHNEAITELVKNLNETHRIVEQDGKLVQKIYPIYKDPDPDHPIDFDAQFYMPSKHFLNQNIDTFYFNTGVIWSMSLALAISLYFDLLRKIIDGIGNLSNPLYKK